MLHRTLAVSLLSALVAAPIATLAQSNGTENYYFPPKLVKRGTAATPIVGPGTVVVKVLVNADGSFKVEDIIRSTNHGNDAAAKEIAQTSTYRAATRGGKPIVAFYDFTLKFTGTSVSSSGDEGELAGLERMIKAGNYAGAKAGLTTYTAAHPDDKPARIDLGVALTFLGDYQGATAAYDAAGTIPANYRAVAGKAYAERAVSLTGAKDYAGAVAAAKRSVELSPNVATYNTLGFAELGAGDFENSIRDLEKARDLAVAAKVSAHDRALIESNLASAYIGAGNLDGAKSAAAEATKLDPAVTGAQVAIASYYAKKGKELADSGKQLEAAGSYEQAALAAPGAAVTMYVNAAFSYLNVKPKPENAKAKADADKALAIDPNSAGANFAAGIALANDGKNTEALAFLNRAEASAKSGNDPNLTAGIQAAIKQVGGGK
jgi:tetratricopeptide (TPR) repeat protein